MPKPLPNENHLPPSSQINVSNLFSVKDKVIVVTGGGSGIGAMIAAGFCDNGSRVYIVSRKDTSAYARELNSRKTGGKCIALQADLSKPTDVENLANEINRLEPAGVHVLVNNAGTNWAQPFTQYSLKGWDRVYDLNVRALFHVTQQFFPALKRAGTRDDPARVINIASIDGAQVTSLPTYAYSSGKAAVRRLSKVLAGQLALQNITVNCILPGAFPSRMMRATIASAGNALVKNSPRQRLGKLEDMAGACIYLSSNAGAWLTGVEITVDGGALLKVDVKTAGAAL